jgi:flagellar biosynthesis/type III secretory pathway protein FliH
MDITGQEGPGRFARLTYDEVFKIVFAAPENEDLLIMLLNLLIPEIDVREITFIDKEQHGFAFNEKNCNFDVYVRTSADERAVMNAQTRKQVDKAMTTKIDILQGMYNRYVEGLEEGLATGREEGFAEGRAEAVRLMAEQLRKAGMSDEEVKRIVDATKS